MTTCTLLTPPCAGAIATLAVEGPQAWPITRKLFSKPLPEIPPRNCFWYGQLGGDDVILAGINENRVEIHSHGGRRIVLWIQKEFTDNGCEIQKQSSHRDAWEIVQNARTLRTASILLDQANGAFDRAVQAILDSPSLEGFKTLAKFAHIGKHLIEPWRIAVAGKPNVGKSSLVNALMGYERAIVSPIAGTTRDVVSTFGAFDGWPVEISDTAGLRVTSDALEATGVKRARDVLLTADVVVWVTDATDPDEPEGSPSIVVANKCDLKTLLDYPNVSAKTGHGIPGLIASIVRNIVPDPPQPGAAVPYTPELADKIVEAYIPATTGQFATACQILESCLSNSRSTPR